MVARKVCIAFDQDRCFLMQTDKDDEIQSVLIPDVAKIIRNIGAVGIGTRAILGPEDYQLIRAKKPAVPIAGMKEALLWQEQAHFLMPVHELILEYRECRVLGSPPMVYVIAVSKSALQSRYDVLQAAGLSVLNITISECVYAEYIQAHYPGAALVVWVHISQAKAYAVAYVAGDLAAIIRLPSANLEEQARTLMQYYEHHLKGFDQEPLWLVYSHTPMHDMRLMGKTIVLHHASAAYYGGVTF